VKLDEAGEWQNKIVQAALEKESGKTGRQGELPFGPGRARMKKSRFKRVNAFMQKFSSPPEVAELELALEKSRQLPGFRAGLAFFWGLIMAKCLLAQWSATVYHIPINTGLYVWTLSVGGSGALTLVYAFILFRELPRMPLSGRIVSATWLGCGAGFVVLAVVAVVYGTFSIYLLPALAAVLLGVGCHIHSVVTRQRLFKFLAVGWWLAALGLFTQPTINSLAWMALSLALLVVLPAGWMLFARRKTA
jgi:hypothetical protein